MYSKSDAIFPKIEMNNEWKINFKQNNPLGIQNAYSTEFFMGQSTCFSMMWNCTSKQLDIKLGPFTQEELDSVLRKI